MPPDVDFWRYYGRDFRLSQTDFKLIMLHICRRCEIRRPTFATPAEQNLARELQAVLRDLEIGNRVPDSEVFRAATSSLEHFIPEVLREAHPEWKYESLDAVFPEIALKTGTHEIDIVGTCIVLSDQTMVPVQVSIRVSATENAIESMECRLGELVGKTMKRVHYGGNHGCRLSVAPRLEMIRWAFHVSFGLHAESREL